MHVLFILFLFVTAGWGQLSIIRYLTLINFTEVLHYIDQAGLTATLNGTENYTIFAPYNRAFYELAPSIRNDTALMTDLLKYSVVSGVHDVTDVSYNEEKLTSLHGSGIRINHYLSTLRTTAEGQRTYGAVLVENGVIVTMESIMLPPTGNVPDIIANDDNLITLRKAIQTAGLDNFFQGVLKYHVIPGTLYADGFHSTNLHTFEEADRLNLQRFFNNYDVDGAHIDYMAQSATNGVVHKIDQVLIPSSLANQRTTIEGVSKLFRGNAVNGFVYYIVTVMEPPVGPVLDVIANDVNLTNLTTAIQTAGLNTFFLDQDPITLFAPTNKAFSLLGAGKLAALLKDPTLLTITSITTRPEKHRY